mgnify:CR=1 FL=1
MSQLEKLKQEKREAKAQMTIARPLRGYLGNKYDYWKGVYDKANEKIIKLTNDKPKEKKIFSRELVLVHISGLYISLCQDNYRGDSKEEWENEQEKRKLLVFKNNHHSEIIPKVLLSWEDIKDFAVFQGYPMKERRELFDLVINRGGFVTYIVKKKTFYGIRL